MEGVLPEIGEIKGPSELGLADSHKRMWVICPVCSQGRWVALTATKRAGFTGRCHQCNALYRGGYRIKKGGRWISSQGYVMVLLQPDDFFYPMAGQDGYVGEHRLVVARALGRCLQSWEIVHHKGIRCKGIKNRSDNLEDNLQLVSDDRHKQITILENKIARLQKENKELKAENRRLKNAK